MNYLQIDLASICDGLGFRVVLWVAGCSLKCPGCHNPETWDMYAGKAFGEKAKEKLFEFLSKPWVKGLTITGGHPLEKYNLDGVYSLVSEVKEKFSDKDVWLYTGLVLSNEDILSDDQSNLFSCIVRKCDVVVDGPYVQNERDVTIAFRGSSNQRLIDVQESIKNEKIVLLDVEDKY